MSDKSKIQWTDASWQPVVGCTKVSPGCKNCYAERMACRLAAMACSPKKTYAQLAKLPESSKAYCNVVKWYFDPKTEKTYREGWNGETVCIESALDKPLHWMKPRRIFVCSMGDLFHESVPFEFIDKVMAVIALCPQHTFQVLTKRPERMAGYFNSRKPSVNGGNILVEEEYLRRFKTRSHKAVFPYLNLWLGTTCENQEMWNERWRYVSAMPGAIKYVSHEPLLSQIEPVGDMLPDWAIIGCESLGKKAGRFQDGFVEAAIKLASFYKSLYVPVFVKQVSINGKVSKKMSEWPEELQIQEFPKGK